MIVAFEPTIAAVLQRDSADEVAVANILAVGGGAGVSQGFATHTGHERDIACQIGRTVIDLGGREADGLFRDRPVITRERIAPGKEIVRRIGAAQSQ